MGVTVGAVLGRQTADRPALAPNPAVTIGVPGVGPRVVKAGIPVGYPHTAQGAAVAAGNYLAVLGGRLSLDPTAATAALDSVTVPGSRAQLEQGFRASLQVEEGLWGIQAAARGGRHVILTQTPIAYRVISYTPAEASISLWLVTNVGVENHQRLAAFFGISSATLAWLDGDWRLRSVDAGSRAGDVVPACLQTPTPTGGVPANLDGFVPYGS